MKDILLIEEGETLCNLKENFEDEGFVVSAFNSSKEAITDMGKSKYAVIIANAEVVSEDKNFWEARNKYAEHIPVILTCKRENVSDILFPVKQRVYEIVLMPALDGQLVNMMKSARLFYLGSEHVKETLDFLKGGELHFLLPSDLNIVGSASEYISRFVRIHGYEDEALDIRIAFEEGLINAIRHGNKSDSQKKVRLFVHLKVSEIVIEIEDEGEGFDYADMFKKEANPKDEDIFLGHGRGIMLMRLHTDMLKYERDGSKLVLIKKRN